MRLLCAVVAFGVLAGLVLYLAASITRVDLTIVGPATVDIVPDGSTPVGGSVSYAAVAAKALGLRACVVTTAGPGFNTSVFDGHELHIVPAEHTLTFEHSYGSALAALWWGHSRKLRVTAEPGVTLSRSHVPRHCMRARVILLGPLTHGDMDSASFLRYDSLADRWWRGPQQLLAVIAQGHQRTLGPRGVVQQLPTPSSELMAAVSPRMSVFLSDVETEGWSSADLGSLAAGSARLIVTAGAKGAQEWDWAARRVRQVDAVPVANVVDTNGAGDTFATAYMLAVARGLPAPGAAAAWAASRAVMQPQSCKPHCTGDLLTWADMEAAAHAAAVSMQQAAWAERQQQHAGGVAEGSSAPEAGGGAGAAAGAGAVQVGHVQGKPAAAPLLPPPLPPLPPTHKSSALAVVLGPPPEPSSSSMDPAGGSLWQDSWWAAGQKLRMDMQALWPHVWDVVGAAYHQAAGLRQSSGKQQEGARAPHLSLSCLLHILSRPRLMLTLLRGTQGWDVLSWCPIPRKTPASPTWQSPNGNGMHWAGQWVTAQLSNVGRAGRSLGSCFLHGLATAAGHTNSSGPMPASKPPTMQVLQCEGSCCMVCESAGAPVAGEGRAGGPAAGAGVRQRGSNSLADAAARAFVQQSQDMCGLSNAPG